MKEKNKSNLVSVIMSTYKEPKKWVQLAVESILKQTYINIELIIVIDDPENIEIINYLQSMQDKRIFIIRNERNIGLVGSLNRALTKATGKFIARMDADDISYPTRLEEQMMFLQDNGYDLCGTCIEYFNDSGVKLISKVHEHEGTLKKVMKYCHCGGVAHPTWFGRKEVFINLEGYREIDACEDFDFLARASLKGYKIGNLNKVLLRYRINDKSISHVKEKKQFYTSRLIGRSYKKNKVLDMDKYMSLIESRQNLLETNICYKLLKAKRKIFFRLFYEFEKIERKRI